MTQTTQTNCSQCGGPIGGHEPVVTVGRGRPESAGGPAGEAPARRYHLECWLVEARPPAIADGRPTALSEPRVAALQAARTVARSRARPSTSAA